MLHKASEAIEQITSSKSGLAKTFLQAAMPAVQKATVAWHLRELIIVAAASWAADRSYELQLVAIKDGAQGLLVPSAEDETKQRNSINKSESLKFKEDYIHYLSF